MLAWVAAGCGAEVPLAVREEMVTTASLVPDATTIVFFTDFECPFCRQTHAALAPLLDGSHGPVRVVLKHVPLPRHPDARGAARADICFERIAQPGPLADEYTAALFASDDLSDSALERIAEEHGVARDPMQRCLQDPATEARIKHDLALFDAVGGDGVPLLFVGTIRLEGAQSRADLAAAIDKARPHP